MQRAKLVPSSIFFRGNILTPSDKCRNLGVIFYSDLTFKNHISDICRSSFYHIRQLRQIRASLDTNSSVLLASALVSSKLDYCNSLFYNLPDKSLNRLQLVQNALARVVVPSVRRNHHITPTLRQLHWLPIQKRITFKIAFITFKTLHHKQPAYLAELLTPRHDTSHNTRSSYSPNFLSVPKINSERGRRSFLYAAPTIWNSLPDSLRASVSVSSFLSGLKTHLFFRSFSLSLRTDLLDFGTGTGISLSGSVFSSQGWCVCILLWPLRASPKSSPEIGRASCRERV